MSAMHAISFGESATTLALIPQQRSPVRTTSAALHGAQMLSWLWSSCLFFDFSEREP
jgi:hypothetical protein